MEKQKKPINVGDRIWYYDGHRKYDGVVSSVDNFNEDVFYLMIKGYITSDPLLEHMVSVHRRQIYKVRRKVKRKKAPVYTLPWNDSDIGMVSDHLAVFASADYRKGWLAAIKWAEIQFKAKKQ